MLSIKINNSERKIKNHSVKVKKGGKTLATSNSNVSKRINNIASKKQVKESLKKLAAE